VKLLKSNSKMAYILRDKKSRLIWHTTKFIIDNVHSMRDPNIILK